MPNHISERIASLRELIARGLYHDNLDKAVAECNALSQDTAYVLPFFVLKQVFAETSNVLEGEPVSVARHAELIAKLAHATTLILDRAERGECVDADDLEAIVKNHIQSINVFRAERE